MIVNMLARFVRQQRIWVRMSKECRTASQRGQCEFFIDMPNSVYRQYNGNYGWYRLVRKDDLRYIKDHPDRAYRYKSGFMLERNGELEPW